MSAPFLLLSTRPELEASQAEYNSFLSMMELEADQLHHIRVDQAPLPQIRLEEYSGIVIGGGPFNTTSPEKSNLQVRVERELAELIRDVVKQDFPLFAACYGIGLFGLALGGVVDRTYGEAPGCITIEATEAGAQDPLLEGMPNSFTSIVGHTEACTELPDNATVLLQGAACPVQMYRVGRNVYATQFHPELEVETFAQRLRIYRDNGYYPPEEYQRIVDEARAADLTVDNQLLLNFRKRFERALTPVTS
ncbi:glutamine amidotransferase [Corynebacterium sp.]|uniref:glutamine amidotransferase n=1 Tax=Corynebacterium sp. TaxID=1720 RepID=UPI0026DAC2E3|nr:glutamine amidotransferase [Corynebacterium sp.]MDO5077443.1 glutamine amidotransferase [Corynebacterium sp.]